MGVNFNAGLPPTLKAYRGGALNVNRWINDLKGSFNQIVRGMYAKGEQGFFYDINDLSTMFQDAAGTVPVTGVGQPVGLVKDKSGRGNHAYQTASASRPILQRNTTTGAYYLAFDGSDDFLVTSSINFTATDKISLFAGVRKLSTIEGLICELSASVPANNGSFYLASPSGPANPNQVLFANKGSIFAFAHNPNLPPPASVVISAKGNISNDTTLIRTNNRQFSSGGDLGTGNYGNHPLYIGRRGGTTLPFNGHIYSLIGIGRLTTDSETAAIDKELAKRTGVTLSV